MKLRTQEELARDLRLMMAQLITKPQKIAWARTNHMVCTAFNEVLLKVLSAELKHRWQGRWELMAEDECRHGLAEHLAKGDPADCVFYLFLMVVRGWKTTKPPVEARG